MSEKEIETYRLRCYCTNCDYGNDGIIVDGSGWFNLPKGVTFTDWKLHHVCPECGCRTLEKLDY